MDEIEQGLRQIAAEMRLVLGEGYAEEDLYALVSSTFLSLQSQYARDMQHMSSDTILQVLRRQMGELVRLKRVGKLLAKRGHVAPKKAEDEA